MIPDSLDYARMVEGALRTVVRAALQQVAEHGLPGEHHFFLTFHTDAPGVVLPPRLRTLYPREMTIVLQHQFSELAVEDEGFSIVLRFDGRPERLAVPFASMIRFVDPAASFGLQFEKEGESKQEASKTEETAPKPAAARAKDAFPPPVTDGKVVDLASFRRPRE